MHHDVDSEIMRYLKGTSSIMYRRASVKSDNTPMAVKFHVQMEFVSTWLGPVLGISSMYTATNGEATVAYRQT
jgi:hypothetical protein